MTHKEDLKQLQDRVAQLMEHFDSVTIFATRHDPLEGTRSVIAGDGSWFARAGQVREWLLKLDAKSRAEAINEILDDEDEEETQDFGDD